MSSTFNNTITQLLTTTPNHADNFNNINSKLLENTKHNKENIDNLTEKVSEIEADTIQINNQIDTLNSKDTELDNKINVLSNNGFNGSYLSGAEGLTDMNTFQKTGQFEVVVNLSEVKNLPYDLNGNVRLTLKNEKRYPLNNDFYHQEVNFKSTPYDGERWYRDKTDGQWSQWRQIATTDKTEILLVNGWINSYITSVYSVSGNVVTVNMRISGGTPSTVICGLPLPYDRVNTNIYPILDITGEIIGNIELRSDGSVFCTRCNNTTDCVINFSYVSR